MSRLRLVFLGLSLSSSWGNGHATTYRALLSALARRGHDIVFLERDQPWYAAHRDLADPACCRLHLYDSVEALAGYAGLVREADAVVIGSFVPEGVAVARQVFAQARGLVAFYDIDTPVTLAKLASGDTAYLSAETLRRFDLYLSFTGGSTLDLLERRHGAALARALYCSVDPQLYRPQGGAKAYALGYLGTYSADRQPGLERLLLAPARALPQARFLVAGPQYDPAIVWPGNVARREHVAPGEHAAFYSSLRLALNLTRADMVAAGHSPSVRLFEAAACGTPILSDPWDGLDRLFEPGEDILIAADTAEALAALALPPERLAAIGAAGRARVLAGHTADHRARQFERHLQAAAARKAQRPALHPVPA